MDDHENEFTSALARAVDAPTPSAAVNSLVDARTRVGTSTNLWSQWCNTVTAVCRRDRTRPVDGSAAAAELANAICATLHNPTHAAAGQGEVAVAALHTTRSLTADAATAVIGAIIDNIGAIPAWNVTWVLTALVDTVAADHPSRPNRATIFGSLRDAHIWSRAVDDAVLRLDDVTAADLAHCSIAVVDRIDVGETKDAAVAAYRDLLGDDPDVAAIFATFRSDAERGDPLGELIDLARLAAATRTAA